MANKKESEGFFFMANGKVLRGEVYWVSVDDSFGSEIQTGRPAVVVSGDKANELLPTVIVAYITSQGKPSPTNVSIKYGTESRRVLCNQIRTIDKQRLTRYEWSLSKSELTRVTGALACAMCIPLATVAKEEPAEDSEKIALKAECDMWKRLYNVTMDQLVEIKQSRDLSIRMARADSDYEDEPELESVVEPEPVVEESPVVEEPEQPKVEVVFEPEPELTEINSCSFADLKHLGFSTNMALTIIEGRPYKTIHDLRMLPGMTSIMFQLVEKKICCNPVAEEKVEETPVVETEEPAPVEQEKININTATARELKEKLGINECYAYSITSHRNKNGLYTDLLELLNVKGLAKVFYEHYKDRLTVGDVVPVEKPSEPGVVEKVNINTAKAKEIIEKLGCSQFYAYCITGYRTRNGRFVELAELKEVPNLPLDFLERYGDRIEIGEGDPEPKVTKVEPMMRKEAFGGLLNVNTATGEEIVSFTQMSPHTARNIVSYRKQHGPFEKLEDLLNVSRFGAGCLKAYGGMLTVGEPVVEDDEDDEEPEEQQEESGKVNINRANIHQLMAVGFEKRAAALIVNERKKYGNYRSVDELSEIPEISGKILRKLRDKLEV